MVSLPRCATCNGPVLDNSCMHCGRSPLPIPVRLGEALLVAVTPARGDGDDSRADREHRQQVPVSVSLERARAWSRGEEAR